MLSFLFCGLGHVYAGRWRRALALYLIDLPVFYGCLLAAMHIRIDALNLYAPLGVYLAYRAWVLIDAVRMARRALGFGRRWIVRWPAYLALFFGVLLLGNYELAKLVRDQVAEAFNVPTGSMAQTVLLGDRILVDKIFYEEPARHDVVVFKGLNHEGREANYMKRIVGLPGERIEIRENVVLVDGHALDEPHVFLDGASWRGDFAPTTVPPGTYFVLGDRRNSSMDSRAPEFGFVPRDRIIGRAMIITFSVASWGGGTRWNRIGKIIQ